MIEKMERITLYGLREDNHKITSRLMRCGCVQIEDPELTPEYEELKEQAARRTVDVYDSEQLLSRLGAAIAALKPYSPKRGLFTPPKDAPYEVMAGGDFQGPARELCAQVEEVQRELSFLRGEIAKEEFLCRSLEPWREMDQPLDALETASSQILLAALPAAVSLEELSAEADARELGAYITKAGEDPQQQYLAAVALRDRAQDLWDLLRQKGGTRVTFPGLKGTVPENMAGCTRRISGLRDSLDTAQRTLSDLGGQADVLWQAYDSTQMLLDRAEARRKMLYTDQTFFFRGWVPARRRQEVEQALAPYACCYEFSEPEEGEEAPILLKNNRFVEPFEVITEMYSMPSYTSVDPNPVLSIFYCLFYGMMLSDAGYGLILAIVGLGLSKKLNMGPTGKKMMRMLGFCGISTVFWGALYGSWFGDAIPVVANVFFGATVHVPMLLDPLKDPTALLILAFVCGYIHILAGVGMKAYLLIKRGHLADALMDVGSWYLIFIGLPLLAAGSLFGESLAFLGPVGKWMSLAGVACLILTQGRDKKNPIMKLVGGVMSLYDAVGYFSDLLSYSRIMALGLATAVIGQVVNIMGTLPGRSVFGVILFLLVFPFGHLLNFAINALGSYVHTSRLHYVEFFGKFFEGGGKAFAPLKANAKYINITQQEEV